MSLNLLKNKSMELAMDLISNHNAILLGSRAFEVNNDFSDWDVAILATDLPNKVLKSTQLDIKNYFNFLPLGNSFLIREPQVDILVFENKEDLNILYEAVRELKDIPSYFLVEKYLRITLFEKALQHYGFKVRDDLTSYNKEVF